MNDQYNSTPRTNWPVSLLVALIFFTLTHLVSGECEAPDVCITEAQS